MKSKFLISVTLFTAMTIFLPGKSYADMGLLVGYKYIDIDYNFHHDTHVDDSFLPNSDKPGSAGTTELKETHWMLIGSRYAKKLSDDLTLMLDIGGLIGVGNRDRKKNANDSRPDHNAAFIYSESKYGFSGGIGLTYNIGQFYIGADAQLSAVYIESGWDRFDDDEKDKSELEWIPTIGPKIGWNFWETCSMETTVQIGESVNVGIAFQYKF